jgi:hypothetical protein
MVPSTPPSWPSGDVLTCHWRNLLTWQVLNSAVTPFPGDSAYCETEWNWGGVGWAVALGSCCAHYWCYRCHDKCHASVICASRHDATPAMPALLCCCRFYAVARWILRWCNGAGTVSLQACHAVWKLTCASTHLCYANVTLQVRWQRVLHGLVHCLVGGGFPGVLAAESQLNCSI